MSLSPSMLSVLTGIGSSVRRGYFDLRTTDALERRGLVRRYDVVVRRGESLSRESVLELTDAGRAIVARTEAA